MLLGAGFVHDPALRPELSDVAPGIRLWRDAYAPPEHELDDGLDAEEEVELVGGFIQEARDWGELGGDLEPIQKVRTGFRLTECLGQLEKAGFYVFGGREIHRVDGGLEPPSPRPVAILRVLRSANPSIVSIDPDNLQAEASEKASTNVK